MTSYVNAILRNHLKLKVFYLSKMNVARETIKVISWILGNKAQKIFFRAIILQIVLSSLDIVFLALISPVVTSLGSIKKNSKDVRILGQLNLTITQVFISICVIIGIKSILTLVLRSWVLKKFADREAEVTTSFVQSSLLEDLDSAKNSHSADLLQLFTGVIGSIFSNILKPAISMAGDLLTLASIIIGLAFIEPNIAFLISAYFIFFGYFIAKILGRLQLNIGIQTLQLNRDSLRIFSEIQLLGVDLKLSNREDESLLKLFEKRQRLARLYARFNVLQAVPRFLFEFLLVAGLVILVSVMGNFGDSNTSLSRLALVVAAGYRVLPALNAIVIQLSAYRNSVPALNRLRALGVRFHMESAPIIYRKQLRPGPTIKLAGDILFNDVTYRYPDKEKNVLTNFNFRIEANKTTLIKGTSGAGKTTIINLVLGRLNPTSGTVSVEQDGLVHKVTDVFSGVRYVSQEVVLLDESIGYNIAMRAITPLDEEALTKVTKSVGIYDRIMKSTNGFNESVGENGSRFSAGERQRIGLARALFNSPSLIILDEPTANLDLISELEVWRALENLKGLVTILVVSHRITPRSLYHNLLDFQELKSS